MFYFFAFFLFPPWLPYFSVFIYKLMQTTPFCIWKETYSKNQVNKNTILNLTVKMKKDRTGFHDRFRTIKSAITMQG